jgi:CDP-diacylglycerol---glycerol-3-phosphate 3-phosphatidyltransferase
MQSSIKHLVRRPLQPLARGLHGLGVRPNHVTLAGLLASLLAACFLARGHLTISLICLLIGLLCDMLDGDIARLDPRRTGPLGAYFDSCADRVSEALVFGGLVLGQAYYGTGLGWPWLSLWVLALTGSFMVSYARARAEGLGISCTVGIAERPERMVVLLALLIAGWRLSIWFLAALALMSWLTVGQRAIHVVRAVRSAADATRSERGAG